MEFDSSIMIVSGEITRKRKEIWEKLNSVVDSVGPGEGTPEFLVEVAHIKGQLDGLDCALGVLFTFLADSIGP